MLGLGFWELVLIGGLALVVIGPERLPHVMRTIGRWYAQIRRTADEMRRAFVLEADRLDAEERLTAMRERQRKAREEVDAAAQMGAVGQERRFPGAPEPPKPADE
jgi:sec-independent protein translocase protein TatB